MASNVFGTPITEETLLGLPDYQDKSQITRKDKADVALFMKNAGGKDIAAQQYLDTIRARAGVDQGCYAMCLIYNATGHTIQFSKARSWQGALQETPYPLLIENGQWGAFLHGPWKGGENESEAVVVYQGQNGDQYDKLFLLSWFCRQKTNKVYVETRDPGHYNSEGTWGLVKDLLEDGDLVYTEKNSGCYILGAIGDPLAHASFEAIITLDGCCV